MVACPSAQENSATHVSAQKKGVCKMMDCGGVVFLSVGGVVLRSDSLARPLINIWVYYLPPPRKILKIVR